MPVTMLSEQYRMDPAISAFPASFFYGGQLKNHSSVVQRAEAGDLPDRGYCQPMAFFDCRCAPLTALTGQQLPIARNTMAPDCLKHAGSACCSRAQGGCCVQQACMVISLLPVCICWSHEACCLRN